MAQQCGKKADLASDEYNGDAPVVDSADNREPITGRFVRYVGFVCLCGVGMGILAAVVLLPPYSEFLEIQHRNKCGALRLKESEGKIAANDRFYDAAGANELITRRLALSTMGLKSDDDIVVKSQPNAATKIASVSLAAIKYPDPPAPDRRIMYLAAKLRQPKTRFGLLMLSGLMIILSLLLFAPPSRKRKAEVPGA